MLDLLWDLLQQGQIRANEAQSESARTAARDAARQAEKSMERTMTTEERIERLALLCQAMWELLSERGQITNNDLMRRVLEVDLRDGKQDNQIAARVVDCPKCKSKVNSRRPKCIICGSVIATAHPFDV